MRAKIEAYKRSISIYGIVTLLILLKEYEQAENYRECEHIYQAIAEQNESFVIEFNSPFILPTHINQINPSEYLRECAEKLGVKEYRGMKDMDYYIKELKNYVR